MSQITYDTVALTWRRGFPAKSGMYLVEFEDGEHIVTPYQADWRYTGWVYLMHPRAIVVAWAEIPKSRR